MWGEENGDAGFLLEFLNQVAALGKGVGREGRVGG
jgi:hypothetical protein